MKGKSLKIRSGAFSLLKELVLTIKGCLTDYVANIIPGIQLSLGVKLFIKKNKLNFFYRIKIQIPI